MPINKFLHNLVFYSFFAEVYFIMGNGLEPGALELVDDMRNASHLLLLYFARFFDGGIFCCEHGWALGRLTRAVCLPVAAEFVFDQHWIGQLIVFAVHTKS